MKRQFIGYLVFVVVLASAFATVGLAMGVHAQAVAFQATPVSPQEIEEVALKYTQARMAVVSGSPEVVLARSVKGVDLSLLGLPEINSRHPLMLVIVKGDIDVTGAWPGSSQGQTRFNYIDYVFDLQTGTPILIQGEIDGGVLKRALDPSLQIRTSVQAPIPVATPLPDGAVAPTTVPPSSP